ncbi:MFS transporter [Streptomyces sp. NPDC005953]|uniref:MFS transporter n=1 Tax=Streptomyces sp. NPDC005953 TaxID=3156719 RepID=UPI003402A4A5
MKTYRQIFGIREFRVLFLNTTVGVAGGTMRMLAVATVVYTATGSPLLTALAFLGGFLPQAIGSLTLLSLADRLPPRAALVTWRVVDAMAGAMFALGFLPVWAVLLVLLVVGLGDAVVGAIGEAVVLDVVPEGSYVLGRSALNIAVGSMQILGFAASGALLALTGPSGAFWLSAGLALTSALVSRLGLQRRPPRTTGEASVALTWAGNRRLWGDRTIRRLLLAHWLPNGLIVGAEAMYVPYGAGAGAMFAAAACGMLVGDIVIGRWVSPRLRATLSLPLYALLAMPYIFFALQPAPVVATAIVLVASFGYAGTLGVTEQFVAKVPEDVRGQAFGLVGNGMMTAQAVCAAAVGGVAQLTHPGNAMSVAAIFSLMASVLLLWPMQSASAKRSAERQRPSVT